MNCTRNVLGTDVLRRTFEDKKFASGLKEVIDPKNNFLFVTSKSKNEIETQGLDFNHVITTVEKSLDGKIHFVEITSEIHDNLEFYKNTDSTSKNIYDENLVYCLTTNSVFLTQDDKTKRNCQKTMCKINKKIGVVNNESI